MIRDGSIVSSSTWAVLPPDLLRLIYKKLYDTFDFIHFRAVCKWWREVAPLSDHPSQYPFYLQRKNDSSTEFTLYSYTGKTRKFQVPEACGKMYSGHSQGYLIMYQFSGKYDSNNATLLNPFTRAERLLPFCGYYYIEPIYVSGDPIINAGELVVHMGYEQRTFARLRENEYKECNVGYPCRPTAYYKGRLFYMDWYCKKTIVFDLTTGTLISRINFPIRVCAEIYLVEGPDTLFKIQSRFSMNRKMASVEHCCFDVYQLVEDEKPLRWAKQRDIGDLMIFLNFDKGFCLSAVDFDGFNGNCIHFTEWYKNQILVGRYDLGKDKSELIGKVGSTGYWIVPNVY